MTKPSATCLTCKHYYITWEPKTPRGCKLYGFKSTQLPSMIVKTSTGKNCDGHGPKESNHDPFDFNRKDYW